MKAALSQMKHMLTEVDFPCIFISSHNLVKDFKYTRRLPEPQIKSYLATDIGILCAYVSVVLAILNQENVVDQQHDWKRPSLVTTDSAN